MGWNERWLLRGIVFYLALCAFVLFMATPCHGSAASLIKTAKEHYHPHVPSPLYFSKVQFPATYFLGVPWCGATALMIAAATTRRELTIAEANIIVASCVLPILGGMIMKRAFELHPAWNKIRTVTVRYDPTIKGY